MKVRIAKRKRPRDKMPVTQGWNPKNVIANIIIKEYTAIATENETMREIIFITKEG